MCSLDVWKLGSFAGSWQRGRETFCEESGSREASVWRFFSFQKHPT